MNQKTQILLTNLSLDELFIAIQPDEQSKQEAIRWLETLHNGKLEDQKPSD